MRFMFKILVLAVVGVAGWIIGSLHPAPEFVLTPIKQMSSDAASSVQTFSDADAASTPATPTSGAPANDGLPADYRAWISEARAKHPYPESEERMYAVMMCESGGRADIVNPAGPYTGLFQYATGTWNGDWNDYRDAGMLDARAQIFATALAWSKNMQSHWGCYTHPR